MILHDESAKSCERYITVYFFNIPEGHRSYVYTAVLLSPATFNKRPWVKPSMHTKEITQRFHLTTRAIHVQAYEKKRILTWKSKHGHNKNCWLKPLFLRRYNSDRTKRTLNEIFKKYISFSDKDPVPDTQIVNAKTRGQLLPKAGRLSPRSPLSFLSLYSFFITHILKA